MERFIDKTAVCGKGCKFGFNVVLMANVQLGDNVKLGNNTVVYPGTVIGSGSSIQDNSVIGRPTITSCISTRKRKELPPLRVGERCIFGACVVLYWGTVIGSDVMIADLASVREQCEIGDFSIIGRGVLMEYETKIGKRVKIQTGTHITGNMVVEDNVFFGPHVVTMNDKQMDRAHGLVFSGPYVKFGARIGSNATLLSNITIGREAVVAAGAVVTKSVEDFKIVAGCPAKVIKEVPPELRFKNIKEH